MVRKYYHGRKLRLSSIKRLLLGIGQKLINTYKNWLRENYNCQSITLKECENVLKFVDKEHLEDLSQ